MKMGKSSKVGAPKGNKNAEKWTEETVLEAVVLVYEYCKNHKTPFLGIALNALDFSAQRWSEWTKKFSDNKVVLESIKKTETLIEANLVEGGMKGDFNSTMAIFTLKNKHGWRDKKEVDNNHSGKVEVPGLAWARK